MSYRMSENGEISLSKVERLILLNQFKILDIIGDPEMGTYAHWIKALEYGYEYHYDEILQRVSDNLPRERCMWVLDVLDMHRMMWYAWEAGGRPEEIEKKDIIFRGFDGNNESELLGYVLYFLEDRSRYEELQQNAPRLGYNSHSPMVGVYDRMLEQWHLSQDKYSLTLEDLKRIVKAKKGV